VSLKHDILVWFASAPFIQDKRFAATLQEWHCSSHIRFSFNGPKTNIRDALRSYKEVQLMVGMPTVENSSFLITLVYLSGVLHGRRNPVQTDFY
jgi:hypothetical protein